MRDAGLAFWTSRRTPERGELLSQFAILTLELPHPTPLADQILCELA